MVIRSPVFFDEPELAGVVVASQHITVPDSDTRILQGFAPMVRDLIVVADVVGLCKTCRWNECEF